MPSYIQDCPCNSTIYTTVVISTVPKIFLYISYSTNSHEAATIQTSLYFKRVNLNIITDKMKGDINNNLASTSRHDTEDNSDHIRFHTNTIFRIICFSVIWYLKLQAYTNLFLISTAFSTILYTIALIAQILTQTFTYSHHIGFTHISGQLCLQQKLSHLLKTNLPKIIEQLT